MTTPGDGDSMQAQMLLKISNDVATLVTDVAVIKTQLAAVPDHEQRIRLLEAEAAQAVGGKDVQARVTGFIGLAAAVGAGVAGYLHH